VKLQCIYLFPSFYSLPSIIDRPGWDTAGTESFRSITRSYYRGAAGALVVYDTTNRNSRSIQLRIEPTRQLSVAGFNNARTWLADVREHADPNLSCMLVANKVDLCTPGDSNLRQVSSEEAQSWADQEGLQFLEASAKSGENVDVTFELVCREIMKKIKAGVFEGSKVFSHFGGCTLD
jgi:Ras-related protein Rab-2A